MNIFERISYWCLLAVVSLILWRLGIIEKKLRRRL